MKFKKMIAGILSLSVMLTAVPVGMNLEKAKVNAESISDEEQLDEYLRYRQVDEDDDGTYDYAEISYCDETASEIIIPDEINSLPVKSIGEKAFENCTSLTAVEIPASVTTIKSEAFSSCESLINIELPDSISDIGDSAFWNCTSLAEIKIPAAMTSIGEAVFWDCISLASVKIPDSITSIGNTAFYDCTALTSIDIPESVVSIGDAAFYCCESLTSITINNPECEIFDDSLTICNGESAGRQGYFSGTVYGTENSTAQAYAQTYDYNFAVIGSGTEEPAETSGICGETLTWELLDGVLTISGEGEMTDYDADSQSEYKSPFYNRSDIESVVIENGVKNISKNAFYGCKLLASAEIAESVVSIGEMAFYNCASLASIRIENPECEIYDDTLTICNGEDANWQGYYYGVISCYTGSTAHEYAEKYGYSFELIDAGMQNENNGVCGDNLTWELFEDGVLIISGEGDMYDYDFIFDSTAAENAPFYNRDDIKYVIIEDGVTSIGRYAFMECTSISGVELPNSLKTIGSAAFYDCVSLTGIEIPDGVTTIEEGAFLYCGSLESITIGKSLTKFPNSAFEQCTALSKISVSNDNEAYSSADGVLLSKDKTVLVMYPTGKSELKYTVPDSVTEIGESAFAGSASVETIILPETVKTISNNAFCNCKSLKNIKITNPKCSIYDFSSTICNSSEEGRFSGTIYGSANSTAQEYANKYNYAFSTSDITEPQVTTAVTTNTTTTKTTAVTIKTEVSSTAKGVSSTTSAGTTTKAVSETTKATTAGTTTSVTTSKRIVLTLKTTGTSASISTVSSETTTAVTTTAVTTTAVSTDGAPMGDANGDGKFNVRDAAYIAKLIAQSKKDELPAIADFNGDGTVNIRDAAAIAKFLASAGKK